MGSEAEAYRVWWALHPTLADGFLFIVLAILSTFFWANITGNKKERRAQIEELKVLVSDNITEIRDIVSGHIASMRQVMDTLQEEKRAMGEHLIRHEKISEDLGRICRTIEDHEARLRATERWTGKERRG